MSYTMCPRTPFRLAAVLTRLDYMMVPADESPLGALILEDTYKEVESVADNIADGMVSYAREQRRVLCEDFL